MGRLSNFLLCGWRLLFSISAPGRGSGKPPCKQRYAPTWLWGLTRRLRRGRWGCRLMGFHQLRCLKVSKGRAESPLVRPLAHTSCRRGGGLTRRLRRGRWGCRPEGGSTFFRSERKYQRKPAARRLQRRPTSLCAVGFGLREPFGLSSTSVRFAHPPGKSPLLPILPAGLVMSRAA